MFKMFSKDKAAAERRSKMGQTEETRPILS
jgi:hypothetical protein